MHTSRMQKHPHPLAADQDETVDDLLRTSARKSNAVPIRRTFVQQGEQRNPLPGPLARMLRAQDERALDLFLLHRAVASSEPWDVTRDARVWGRALGLQPAADGGAVAVSKAWRRMESNYRLVSRERIGRLARVTSLREDGSGKPYSYPGRTGRDERYLKLPYAYWAGPDRWYRNLSFPAKAMLLIALSLPAGFVLPTERAPKWYGISADSADRGLRELSDAGLLARKVSVKKAPQAPQGFAKELRHTLQPPYTHRRSGTATVRLLRSVS